MSVATSEVRRSKDGRPYILSLETGKEVLYTRASTFAKALSDGAALEAWKMRMAYLGLTAQPGLLGAVERVDVDTAIAIAMDAAGANEAARMGTALHGLSEWVDRGEAVDGLRLTFQADAAVWDALDRYVEVTKDLVPVEIERFVVNDELKVAGTFDRTLRLPDGRLVMADLKTGSRLRMLEHAMQLALYANSAFYDVATGVRAPLECDRRIGLIVFVPFDPSLAETRLVWVDLEEGWRMCQLAAQVRAVRRIKFEVASPMVGDGKGEDEK